MKLAIVLAVVNTIIRPILVVLAFPFYLLTLGLFVFVVNAAMLKLAGALVDGVEVKNWATAIIAAVMLAVINAVLGRIF